MEDFLPNFKPLKRVSLVNNRFSAKNEFFYQLAVDEEKNVYLQTVDKIGNPIEIDYNLYSGPDFKLLREIASCRDEEDMSISWGDQTDNLYLKDYPHLLYLLLQCNNIVDGEMKKVVVSGQPAQLNLLVLRDNRSFTPMVELETAEICCQDFVFLSDMYVMAHGAIYTVESVGENYGLIKYFSGTINEKDLEKFFSVFYSYVQNIKPKFEDYELEYSDNVVKTIPTVIIEKIDADKALYLKVQQCAEHVDYDFLTRYEISYLASLSIEKKIVLKRIEKTSQDNSKALLRSYITKYAPSKSALKELVETLDDEFILNEELAGPFLLQGLLDIIKDFQLLGAEKLVDYKVKPVQPKLNVKLGSGIDFFEGEADVTLGDQVMSLSAFLNDYRKHKYVTLNDGNRAIIDEAYVHKLERLFNNSQKKGKVKVSFFDLPEIESLLQEKMEGAVFDKHREVYEGFNKLPDSKLKGTKVKAELRPYQEEGVKWINYLYQNNLGGCLADDMGLGKTLQTISMLTLIYPKTQEPTLIVMPKSLLFNWNSELTKFAPQLKSYTYYGSNRDIDEAKKQQIILTTYAIVRNDIETFKEVEFNYIILDESQNIKNVAAQTTQAVNLLTAKHRLALSGTPVENNLTELYSLFRFLNPAMFGSLDDFNSRYTYPIQKDDNKEVMDALRRKIFPFMLRRLKKDVLTELPDRIDQMLYVEMDKEHAKLYEKKRSQFALTIGKQIAQEGVEKSQFLMFQALNELRRLASVPESLTDNRIESPKIPVLIETLSDAVFNGHKVVVFFNYIAGIELVGEKLEEAGIDYTCMTGSTNDRQGVVNRFQNDAKCRVLLMTLKTGGVGLNLTAADTVFIFEPWWNKAAEEQAINRLHRFGQTAKVLSYSIITKGTIEEKINLLQQQKAELFAGLIGNDSSSTKHLSEEDIKFILD